MLRPQTQSKIGKSQSPSLQPGVETDKSFSSEPFRQAERWGFADSTASERRGMQKQERVLTQLGNLPSTASSRQQVEKGIPSWVPAAPALKCSLVGEHFLGLHGSCHMLLPHSAARWEVRIIGLQTVHPPTVSNAPPEVPFVHQLEHTLPDFRFGPFRKMLR
jgi:hypothetical protein